MSEWFQERYIPRSEHREIVDYYRKLVAQLHGKVRALRDQLEGQPTASWQALAPSDLSSGAPLGTDWTAHGENVISLEARRLLRAAAGRIE